MLKIREDDDFDSIEDEVMDDESVDEAEESDEIDELEEGFIKGYEEDTNMTECANCHRILTDKLIEQEIGGEVFRFCSEKCAEKFEKRHEMLK